MADDFLKGLAAVVGGVAGYKSAKRAKKKEDEERAREDERFSLYKQNMERIAQSGQRDIDAANREKADREAIIAAVGGPDNYYRLLAQKEFGLARESKPPSYPAPGTYSRQFDQYRELMPERAGDLNRIAAALEGMPEDDARREYAAAVEALESGNFNWRPSAPQPQQGRDFFRGVTPEADAINSTFSSKALPAPQPRGQWDDLIEQTAAKYGVPASDIRAIMSAESAGRADARSPKGAYGLMQLMPGTAAELGVDPSDPAQNIDGGVRYYKQMLERYGGDRTKALAAYNAGPGNVDKYGGVPPFEETQNYVRRIEGMLGGQSAPQPGAAASPLAQRRQEMAQRSSLSPAQWAEAASRETDELQAAAEALLLAASESDDPSLMQTAVRLNRAVADIDEADPYAAYQQVLRVKEQFASMQVPVAGTEAGLFDAAAAADAARRQTEIQDKQADREYTLSQREQGGREDARRFLGDISEELMVFNESKPKTLLEAPPTIRAVAQQIMGRQVPVPRAGQVVERALTEEEAIQYAAEVVSGLSDQLAQASLGVAESPDAGSVLQEGANAIFGRLSEQAAAEAEAYVPLGEKLKSLFLGGEPGDWRNEGAAFGLGGQDGQPVLPSQMRPQPYTAAELMSTPQDQLDPQRLEATKAQQDQYMSGAAEAVDYPWDVLGILGGLGAGRAIGKLDDMGVGEMAGKGIRSAADAFGGLFRPKPRPQQPLLLTGPETPPSIIAGYPPDEKGVPWGQIAEVLSDAPPAPTARIPVPNQAALPGPQQPLMLTGPSVQDMRRSQFPGLDAEGFAPYYGWGRAQAQGRIMPSGPTIPLPDQSPIPMGFGPSAVVGPLTDDVSDLQRILEYSAMPTPKRALQVPNATRITTPSSIMGEIEDTSDLQRMIEMQDTRIPNRVSENRAAQNRMKSQMGVRRKDELGNMDETMASLGDQPIDMTDIARGAARAEPDPGLDQALLGTIFIKAGKGQIASLEELRRAAGPTIDIEELVESLDKAGIVRWFRDGNGQEMVMLNPGAAG